MQNDNFNVFIAYHGTYDVKNGSVAKAEKIYEYLTNKGINCYFFPKMTDRKFGRTPVIASQSDLFLLVANHNIRITKNNEVASHGLSQEIDAFYDEIYKRRRSKGDARVYVFGDLKADQADDLHLMFRNIEHFVEKLDGEERCFRKVYEWVKQSARSNLNDLKEEIIEDEFNLNELYRQSRQFFRDSILKICDLSDEEYYPIYQTFSRLFECNALLKKDNVVSYEGELFDYLTYTIEHTEATNILKVTGNAGSEKNALMQNLFINIYRRALNGENNIIPFYINLSYYEKLKSDSDINKFITERISSDLSYFCEFIKSDPQKTPILFIDGLRNFKISQTSIELILERIIDPYSTIRKVVSIDTDTIQNSTRKVQINNLAPTTFSYYLRIQPIDLENEEGCKKFLTYFGMLNNVDALSLQSDLKKLFFYEVDAYIVKHVVSMLKENRDAFFTVSDLYLTLCKKYMDCNEDKLLITAKDAFDFRRKNDEASFQ